MSRLPPADVVDMTTFEELDLGEAFGDFGDAGTEARRISPVRAGVAVLVAFVLVVLGVLWLGAARDEPVPAVEATAVVPVLGAAQTAADRIPGADLDSLTVLSSSTRLIGTSAWGTHYAALDQAGAVCLVTLREGDLPVQTCGGPSADLTLATTDVDGRDVVLLTAPGTAPTTDGWERVTDRLWTRP